MTARRAAIIVLDGVGIGAASDAAAYGDAGSNTLGNVARAVVPVAVEAELVHEQGLAAAGEEQDAEGGVGDRAV